MNAIKPSKQSSTNAAPETDFDAIVVGAGFAGLGLVHYLREAGISLRVFDKADDIGGTWTWNRYPGARTDSEGYYYCFTFSPELLQEWQWTERYPSWDEALSYLRFVADQCDMWPDIQLNTTITSAIYEAEHGQWVVSTAGGEVFRCKYFISAMGLISEPYTPDIKGINSFQGTCLHSARWPKEGLDYAGKRVGIIGAGATAVQMVPVMAETAASVTMFQRTPNHIIPARQQPMTEEWERDIKANYQDIIDKCRHHIFGMPFDSPVNRLAVDTPEQEREAIFEEVWQKGGFRFCFETFDDLLSDFDANAYAADFVCRKMKARVNDPKTAELLAPKDYPLFAKRPPLDHGYLEAFNRDNVHLVDIANTESLVEITPQGVRTTENEYAFDILVMATGFDALTGAMESFDIRGDKGETLKEKWNANLATIMGVCTADFPNMFMVTGPQAPFANLPTTIEQNIKWITRCISQTEQGGYDVCAPIQEAENQWSAHASEVLKETVMAEGVAVKTWFLGANIPDKEPRVLIYFGGAHNYFDKLDESADNAFKELEFRRL